MPQQYSFEYERRLRAGIVGCGQHSVRNILPALLYAPVDLVAACDLDIERAEQVGRRFGASGFYGQLPRDDREGAVGRGLHGRARHRGRRLTLSAVGGEGDGSGCSRLGGEAAGEHARPGADDGRSEPHDGQVSRRRLQAHVHADGAQGAADHADARGSASPPPCTTCIAAAWGARCPGAARSLPSHGVGAGADGAGAVGLLRTARRDRRGEYHLPVRERRPRERLLPRPGGFERSGGNAPPWSASAPIW